MGYGSSLKRRERFLTGNGLGSGFAGSLPGLVERRSLTFGCMRPPESAVVSIKRKESLAEVRQRLAGITSWNTADATERIAQYNERRIELLSVRVAELKGELSQDPKNKKLLSRLNFHLYNLGVSYGAYCNAVQKLASDELARGGERAKTKARGLFLLEARSRKAHQGVIADLMDVAKKRDKDVSVIDDLDHRGRFVLGRMDVAIVNAQKIPERV